jgi:hypothetical protein
MSTMRPTGLSFPVERDGKDYTVYSGKWAIGRIYEEHGGPDSLHWCWSLHGWLGEDADLRTDGRAPTLDEAKRSLSRPGGNGSRGRSCKRRLSAYVCN